MFDKLLLELAEELEWKVSGQPRDARGRWATTGNSASALLGEGDANGHAPTPLRPLKGGAIREAVSNAYQPIVDAYGEERDINPSDVMSGQRTVSVSRVQEYMDNPDRAADVAQGRHGNQLIVVQRAGEMAVIDGNHRIAAAVLKGRKIRAVVVDMDQAFADAEAGRQDGEGIGLALMNAAARRSRGGKADLESLLDGIRGLARELKAGVSGARIEAVVESFDWSEWAKDMRDAVEKPFSDVVFEQAERVAQSLGRPFDREDPFTKRTMTDYVGERIVSLDKTTKRDVIELIRSELDAGTQGSPLQLGDKIAEAVRAKFAGYADWRADTIARTETANAYNMGTLLTGAQAGIDRVLVSDGDDDAECAAANGQTWTLAYAMQHLTAHPNCERAFSLLENA